MGKANTDEGKRFFIGALRHLPSRSERLEGGQVDLKEGAGLQECHSADVSILFRVAGWRALAFTRAADAVVQRLVQVRNDARHPE